MSGRLRSPLFLLLLLGTLACLVPSCTGEEMPPPVDPVTIEVYSSSTKEDWLNAAAEAFNRERIKTASGKPILIDVFHVNSGGSQKDILEGKIEPTVWSPGEMSWVTGANEQWLAGTGQPLVAGDCRPTILEPTGFAMWRPMAEAMGWPTRPIRWRDIMALIADPDGWARYGHPEWGRFKLGLTDPETSNSGRLILTGLTYATLGRTEGLTPELVRSEPVIEAYRQIKLQTVEFGAQSAVLLERMVLGGPGELHAINTNEAETLKSNARYGKLLPFPLVFIIPADGTSWGEHPYCVLSAAWVSAEQREAARLFAAYLLEPEQQMLAVEKGLRPVDPSIAVTAPITLGNGANPQATPLTVPALESLSPAVADTITELFARISDTSPAG